MAETVGDRLRAKVKDGELNSKLEVDELSGKPGGDSLRGTTEASRCAVVAFRCAGSSTERGWPEAVREDESLLVHEISVPCSGRLQPEHFLKAFEAGADLVLVLTCCNGDCRYLEGHWRVRQRIDYVRGLLNEVGLGGERLLLLESRAGSDGGADAPQQSDMMREALAAALVGVAPNPLGRSSDEGVG